MCRATADPPAAIAAARIPNSGARQQCRIGKRVHPRQWPHSRRWPREIPRPRTQASTGRRVLPAGCTSLTAMAPRAAATTRRSPAARTAPGSPVSRHLPGTVQLQQRAIERGPCAGGRIESADLPDEGRSVPLPDQPSQVAIDLRRVGRPAVILRLASRQPPGDQRESLDQGGGPEAGQPLGQGSGSFLRARSPSPLDEAPVRYRVRPPSA